jgi:hypothetical protein
VQGQVQVQVTCALQLLLRQLQVSALVANAHPDKKRENRILGAGGLRPQNIVCLKFTKFTLFCLTCVAQANAQEDGEGLPRVRVG